MTGLTQDLVGDPSGKTYTATFTANDGFTGTGSVSVTAGSYTDRAQCRRPRLRAVAIDRADPTVAVDIADGALSDGDRSSTVTFTFSEAPVGFARGRHCGGGRHGERPGGDRRSAGLHGDVHGDDGFTGTGSVSVAAGSYTDARRQPRRRRFGHGDDRPENPTVAVNIVDSALNDGDNSSVVTFTFSEAPVGFAPGDIAAASGTLSGLAVTADPLSTRRRSRRRRVHRHRLGVGGRGQLYRLVAQRRRRRLGHGDDRHARTRRWRSTSSTRR